MRLLVVGGTGQTGKEVVRQALQDGHSVTAVVRSPEKVTESHDNLKVRLRADVARRLIVSQHLTLRSFSWKDCQSGIPQGQPTLSHPFPFPPRPVPYLAFFSFPAPFRLIPYPSHPLCSPFSFLPVLSISFPSLSVPLILSL